MNFFRKKETLVENITFMALMAALNIIFVFISTFVPFLFFLLIFVLPLTSTLTFIFCNKKYYIIYAAATIGLSFIVNIFQISDTVFYVIPSIITGFLFGLFTDKKVPSFYTILVTTIVQAGLTFASIPLVNLFIEVNLIDKFISFVGLSEFAYKDYLAPMFILIISLIQIAITYLIIREEIKKMGVETCENSPKILYIVILNVCLIGLTVGFVFLYGPLSFFFFGISIFVGIYITAQALLLKKILIYILVGTSFLITFFMFALYQYIPAPNGIYLIDIFFLLNTIVIFSNYCLENRHNKDKIE